MKKILMVSLCFLPIVLAACGKEEEKKDEVKLEKQHETLENVTIETENGVKKYNKIKEISEIDKYIKGSGVYSGSFEDVKTNIKITIKSKNGNVEEFNLYKKDDTYRILFEDRTFLLLIEEEESKKLEKYIK